MSHIAHALERGRTLSFEFFPPKTPEAREALFSTVDELSSVDPNFVSVTYGAGGSNRSNTRDLVVELADRHSFGVMPHLTCIGHRRDDLEALIDDYAAHGVHNILALAGDPPADGSPAQGDFTYASELVDLVKQRTSMSVGVAAFPETHPRSPDRASDRRYLANKLEQADFAITQFFFRAQDYLSMIDELNALGSSTPIIPGIQPILNPATIKRFADMNGAWFPEELASRISEASESDRFAIIVDAAASLISELVDQGVPGLHIYCLNRSDIGLALAGVLE